MTVTTSIGLRRTLPSKLWPRSVPRLIKNGMPSIAVRNIITHSYDPQLVDETGNFIREKVYSVVLVEDFSNNFPPIASKDIFSSSWRQPFADYFTKRGVAVKYSSQSTVKSSSSHSLLFANLIEDITQDLVNTSGSIPSSTFVIARGPVVSLAMQYYLESWPLAGLIMVDPLLLSPPFLSDTAATLLDYIANRASMNAPHLEILQELREGHFTRALKIEPGSVPMCVLTSGIYMESLNSSRITANRHSGLNRSVDLHEIIECEDQEKMINNVLETICRFCEDHS